MFRHQLIHDIYITCANRRRNVHLYEPEIDVSGFDLVIDDLSSTLRFQLKSKMTDSSVRGWEIHKLLLRPTITHLNNLPFCSDSSGIGYMGGVILITGHASENAVTYSYSYTDALVISAINKGINPPTLPGQLNAVQTAFRELTQPDFNPDRIWIPQAAFWSFPSLDHILQFAGFNVNSTMTVRHHMLQCLSQLYCKECNDPICPNAEDSKRFVEGELTRFLATPAA